MRTFFRYLQYRIFISSGNTCWLVRALYLLIVLFCIFLLYLLIMDNPEQIAKQKANELVYNKQRAELEQQFMFKYDSLPGEFDIYRCNPTTQRIENIYLNDLEVKHLPKNDQHCIAKEF